MRIFFLALLMFMNAGCPDGSPGASADAAICSCPAAEAPIKPRVMKFTRSVTVPAADPPNTDGRAGMSALCPDNAIVVTGGCLARDGQRADVILEQAYADIANGGGSWQCNWKNTGIEAFTATAVAYCLMPE